MKQIAETQILYGPRGWKLAEITPFDAWWGRESLENCYSQISTIAGLSHATEPRNPESLVEKLIDAYPRHGEPLESVPFMPRYSGYSATGKESIRVASLRHNLLLLEKLTPDGIFHEVFAEIGREDAPATIFKVKCPKEPYIYMLRHEATFGVLGPASLGKNVMSRRKVTDSKVPYEFYGQEDPILAEFYLACVEAYEAAMRRGLRQEEARFLIPSAEMVEFYMWGFDADWQAVGQDGAFKSQRVDGPKVLPEMRIISTAIVEATEAKGKV